MEISERAKNISPSLTLAITAKAKAMKAQGLDVVSFGAGEPDFNTPDYIIEAAKYALDKGMTKYTPVAGTIELRKAICDTFKRDHGLDYTPDQIVVSTGGKQTLRNACEAIINPGDEVILPTPYWLTYPELVKMSGGKCVYIHADISNDFKITPEQLAAAIPPRTKAFIFNNPSNPNGTVYTPEETAALARVLEDKDIYIISDEIYEKLVYGVKFTSIAAVSEKIKEKTIVCTGLSKTYSMTGWRMGYSAAPLKVAKAMSSIQSHTTSNANSIAQYASYVALTDPRGAEFLSKMQKTFDERRKLIVSLVRGIKGLSCNEPKGAFYVMAKLPVDDTDKFQTWLLTEFSDNNETVMYAPGNGFHATPGHGVNEVRLAYVLKCEDIERAMDLLAKAIKQYNELNK